MSRLYESLTRPAGIAVAIAAFALAGAASGLAVDPTPLPPGTASQKAAAPSPSALSVIEACPYAQLKKAYDAAMNGADTLDVFAIDREILSVCNERSQLLVQIIKNDRDLAKLLAPAEAKATDAALPGSGVASTATPGSEAKTAPATSGASKTAAATTGTANTPKVSGPAATAKLDAPRSPATKSTPAAASPAVACAAPAPTSYATYALTAETGATALTIGGVVNEDTGALYTVRKGDPLPGGYRVGSVSAVGVTLTRDGASWLLPANTKTFPAPAEGFYAVPVKDQSTTGQSAPAQPPRIPSLPGRN